MEEFNLSKRINDRSRLNKDISQDTDFYYSEDVKEFIKRLKEPWEDIIKNFEDNSHYFVELAYDELKRIDKLAGDKLI